MKRKNSRRRLWTPPSPEKIREELEKQHARSLNYRSRRLAFIFKEFGPPRDMLLVGGLPSLYSLEEMQIAYIEGLFLSTICCAHVFIEQSLGGQLILANEDKIAESGLRAISDRVYDLGFIDKTIHTKINKLRNIRIAYSHAHVGTKARSHMGRILSSKKEPSQLLRDDARLAIRIVSDFLRHMAPGFNPPAASGS